MYRRHHRAEGKGADQEVDPQNPTPDEIKANLGQAISDAKLILSRADDSYENSTGDGSERAKDDASKSPIVGRAHHEATTYSPDGTRGVVPAPHEIRAVAGKLGMSLGQLGSALRSGKTLASLADDKDVSVQDLNDAAAAAAKTRLDKAVKAGRIDQSAADSILSDIQQGQWLDRLLGAFGAQA